MIPGTATPTIIAAAKLLAVIAGVYVLAVVVACSMAYGWFRLATWRDRRRL